MTGTNRKQNPRDTDGQERFTPFSKICQTKLEICHPDKNSLPVKWSQREQHDGSYKRDLPPNKFLKIHLGNATFTRKR